MVDLIGPDKLRLIRERDHLRGLIGTDLDVVAFGFTSRPGRADCATFTYRAPDGNEYEVLVRERG